jgi:hypothetical protein
MSLSVAVPLIASIPAAVAFKAVDLGPRLAGAVLH